MRCSQIEVLINFNQKTGICEDTVWETLIGTVAQSTNCFGKISENCTGQLDRVIAYSVAIAVFG